MYPWYIDNLDNSNFVNQNLLINHGFIFILKMF